MVDLLEQAEDIDESGRMTLWEHLEELRKRLIISLLSLAVGFGICWFFKEQLWSVVQAPFIQFVEKGDKLSFISLTEPFIVYMKLSALAAIIFSTRHQQH